MLKQLILNLLIVSVFSLAVWPGENNITTVDEKNYFPVNLSGLYYVFNGGISKDIMYGILNKPSVMYKLGWNGKSWVSLNVKVLEF